ncbi:pentapeptide repeat-containing protein [Nonomuraea sp. NPDC049709]|uniref:pentapeptide repeat-containing protein n=1 Tax=Nonomuraea sp. NPDC049709 TaxID=3154736 RepID=UPI003418F273
MLWLTPLLVGIVGAAIAATIKSVPDWGRWTLAGTALAGISTLGIAVLIGPAARRLAGERHPLTQAERGQMTATERVEAVNAARHTLIQAATGLVVIGGVVFTAQGLWYTAQSLDTSLQAQRTAEQGQITDRYTKAVEQLGSTKMDVRLGGMYALERLAQDSPRDHQTVYDVLAAFVREHDPKPSVKHKDLPPAPTTDVHAALIIIGRRDANQDKAMPNLNQIRIAGVNLVGHLLRDVDLRGANLDGAVLVKTNLTGANLDGADLANADLRGANLTDATMPVGLSGVNLAGMKLDGMNLHDAELVEADLTDATLRNADLTRTELTSATLRNADLTGADLTDANLAAYPTRALLSGADDPRADLPSADLRGATLTGADLSGATLTGVDLRGADLRGVRGVTVDEIRKEARVDETTKF